MVEDFEFEEERAERIIKSAESMIKKGNIEKAISAFDKAINMYLEMGQYSKIAAILTKLTKLLQDQNENVILIASKIDKILLDVEKFDIPEEEAKLKLILAEINYKTPDFNQAAQLYNDVAELYLKADPESNKSLAAVFFLKASECYQKIDKIDKAENLILKAVMEIKKTTFDVLKKEQELLQRMKSKKFEESIELTREIARFFRECNEEVERIRQEHQDDEIMEGLIINVRAWLILHVCEYNLLKTICFKELGQIDRMVTQTEKSIKDLMDAISIIKNNIISHGLYSFEDLKMLTIQMFLIQLFQELSDTQLENPITVVERGLPEAVIENLKKLRFYNLTKELIDYGISDDIRILKGVNIGRLTPFWDILEKSIIG